MYIKSVKYMIHNNVILISLCRKLTVYIKIEKLIHIYI